MYEDNWCMQAIKLHRPDSCDGSHLCHTKGWDGCCRHKTRADV